MFRSSHIRSVHAREILDSRGNPTVACRVTLQSGASFESRVPSGASTGKHEAVELRDGGKRFGGKGVKKAVDHVNQRIARALKGVDASKQEQIDATLLELDGTPNKSKLGANALLSVSLGCAQSLAVHRRIPLWQSLRETFAFQRDAALPLATMNVINGGAHAGWVTDVQECMIVPKQKTMRERVRAGSEVFHALRALLVKKGEVVSVGDEGGFAPHLATAEKAFDLLLQAVKAAGYKAGDEIAFACDVASSELYESSTKKYRFRAEKKTYTAEQLLKRYAAWMKKYPFVSIEDPFAEDDWGAWAKALPLFADNDVHVVGDDLLVTNPERLEYGIIRAAANAILIKPNQIGTLSQTVEAILLAHAAGWATSISHRSGDTADTFIADLAAACGSEYIKTGSLSRSERVEKYNRLMEIEIEVS